MRLFYLGVDNLYPIGYSMGMNTTQMKLIGRMLTQPIAFTAEAVAAFFADNRDITLYGFASAEAAEAFAAKFPKYVKAGATTLSGLTPATAAEYGILATSGISHGVSFRISGLTETTGVANEAGQKRLRRFIEVLKAEGVIS